MAIIEKLKKAKSDKRRESIIKEAWETNSEEFFLGLQFSMDPLYDFKIKKVPKYEEAIDEVGEFTFDDFFKIVTQITKSKNISLEEINAIIRDSAEKANPKEWNEFYRPILLKEFQDTLPMQSIISQLSKLTNQNFSNTVKHKNSRKILKDS